MQKIVDFILKIIDFFYKPFNNIIPRQLFNYAFCGGGNMLLDWFLYFIVYNFVLRHNIVHIFDITISSHIATLCIVFPITTLTGFLLNKYITFSLSTLKTPVQFFRYISVVALNLMINYFGLKLLVDVIGFYPTPSKILITLFTIVISFLAQKFYTFK